MIHPVLAWTGNRIVPVSIFPRLPGGGTLIHDADTLYAIPEADLRAMEIAMRINPTVMMFIAPGATRFGHADATDEIVHRAHPDPAWREAYAPRWHSSPSLGRAWKRVPGQRTGVIYLRREPAGMVATLFHELLHTIAWNFTDEEWSLIAAHGDRIRAANLAEDFFTGSPDRRPPLWLGLDEEGPAYAFERYATGQSQPFGLDLPRPVRRLFDRVIRGELADHRAPMQRGDYVTTDPPDWDESDLD